MVEPRVRVLWASYERPGLRMVLLLTSLLSVAGTIATAPSCERGGTWQTPAAASLPALVEREASRVEHAAAPRPARVA